MKIQLTREPSGDGMGRKGIAGSKGRMAHKKMEVADPNHVSHEDSYLTLLSPETRAELRRRGL